MVMEQSEKVRENRLRAMADRQGLRLRKSRRRDPRALDYGGYWLLDDAGADVGWGPKGMSLDEVEHYLTTGERPERVARMQAGRGRA